MLKIIFMLIYLKHIEIITAIILYCNRIPLTSRNITNICCSSFDLFENKKYSQAINQQIFIMLSKHNCVEAILTRSAIKFIIKGKYQMFLLLFYDYSYDLLL